MIGMPGSIQRAEGQPERLAVEPALTWGDVARVVGATCLFLACLRQLAWLLLVGCWALGKAPWPPNP